MPTESVHPPGPADARTSFVGHALWVGGLTFVSRVFGLVRDAVLAACFGMTSVTDAFWIGFLIPNLFRRLFGEGALTAALIPVYTEMLHQDRAAARRLAWLCLAMLMGVTGAVVVITEAALAMALAWAGPEARLAISLTMIMLPYAPMVCTVALIGGVLQVHRRFGPPAAMPIVVNVVMISGACAAVYGGGQALEAREAIRWVAYSVLLAGFIQLAWQGWVARDLLRAVTGLASAKPAMRAVVSAMIPMTAGLAIFQINVLFDSLIAWGLSAKAGGADVLWVMGVAVAYPVEPGAVTGLQFAQRLYQFPLGVFGIAVATTIFPALSHAIARAETTGDAEGALGVGSFGEIVRQGLRLTIFIGWPASAGLILVRMPLTRLLFERYEFTHADTQRVAVLLAGYASAIWAYSMTHVLTRAFFALRDARTPLRVSLWGVGCNLGLNLLLVWPMGAAALAWSTAICASGQAMVLVILLGRRVDRLVNTHVWRSWRRSAILTIVMTFAVGAWSYVGPDVGTSVGGTALGLIGMLTMGLTVVLGGAKWLGMAELTWLVKRGR